MVHNSMKDHFVECTVDQYFSLLPVDSKWSAGAAKRVKEELITKALFSEPPTDAGGKKLWSTDEKQITPFGWKVWRAAFCAKEERETRKSIANMFLEICDVAYELDPQLYAFQTAYFHDSAPTQDDVPASRSTRLPEPEPMAPRRTRANPPCRPSVDPATLSHKTSDCTSFAEFKKKEADSSDNEMQLCVVATHLMHNDPNRRFVCAMTIEGQSVRLWRFDRAVVLVSERFDFNTAPEYLICYALYVSYASATQAGFDPTVTPVPSIPEPTTPIASAPTATPPVTVPSAPVASALSASTPANQPAGRNPYANTADRKSTVKAEASTNTGGKDFIYEVNGRYFRSVGRSLSESNASVVISRGVRVWEVTECDAAGNEIAGGQKGVLKDFWLYKDGRSEACIQEDVKYELALLDKKDPVTPTRVEQIEEYFLTIIECGRVTIDGCDDTTIEKPGSAKQLMLAPKTIRYTTPTLSLREDTRSLPGCGKGPYDNVQHEDPEPLQHHQRVHWRYVVAERCETMYDVSDLRVMFNAGRDIAKALDLFRQAGYMHRDISGGNCMIYLNPTSGKYEGKLADLEFSKKYSTLSCHDPVTGTIEFMPVEYGAGRFQFQPARTRRKKWDDVRKAVYHPHPYHDLESLYWVMVWCILANFLESDPPYRPTFAEWTKWRRFSDATFNPTIGTFLERLQILNQPDILCSALIASGWKKNVVDILDEVISFSCDITGEYKIIQAQPQDADFKFPISLFKGDLYVLFADILAEASDALPTGRTLVMNELKPTVPDLSRKRENDSDDEDAPAAKRPAL